MRQHVPPDELLEAATKGTNFPSAFLSTRASMSRMTDVFLSGFTTFEGADGEGFVPADAEVQ